LTAQTFAPVSAFAFGPFLLIPEQTLLLENRKAVRIGRRAFDVLRVLVEAHGQIVGKRELLARAWPGLDMEQGNLKVHIAAIRRLLGDDAGNATPHYIATVVGRGYRFIAPVHMATQHAWPVFPEADPAPSRFPGNVPPPVSPLFGRDAVIEAILRDLDEARLVSVVGPGGVGKTTVALAVAGKGAASFTAGCWLLDVAQLDQPAQVPAAIAAVMHEGAEDGDGAMLLLLDNCEHLVGAVAAAVYQLLASTRHVKCIVTSREPLAIRGERVRRLAGLSLPSRAASSTAAGAAASAAVQLFATRAREQNRSFRLDDTNAAHVSAICHRLDGLALAIERVARRAGTLGIAAMLDHLDRRFHMVDGFQEGTTRHRTLTAAVHASYILLAPGEQATLRRLAIFTKPFSLDAACAIACAQDGDTAPVLADIASLVDKSLLSTAPCNGEMTFRQMYVTRAYAMDQLIACGELAQVRQRVHALGVKDIDG
jgi:predicted ATPase/DNA-binding winged helix-turn-helix (wHTH) protein